MIILFKIYIALDVNIFKSLLIFTSNAIYSPAHFSPCPCPCPSPYPYPHPSPYPYPSPTLILDHTLYQFKTIFSLP